MAKAKSGKQEAHLRGEVVVRPLESVRPNGWNPNKVPAHVMRSIEHGFRADGWIASNALLVWGTDDTGARRDLIIDGEHKWKAARAVGLKDGPMVVLDGVTEREARALTVKMNQKRGEWDEDGLAALIKSVQEDGVDPSDLALDLGIEVPDITALLVDRPPPDDDEEPVIPTDALVKKWGTAPGQLWIVPSLTVPGREHRLLCGDCCDPANVERLRDGRRPKLGLHDPPYGVNAVNTTRATLADGRRVAKTRSSSKSFEPVHEDDRQFSPVHLLGSAARLVLWGANNYAHLLPPSAEWIMWSKRTGMAESTFSDGELAWVSPHAQGVGHVRGIWHTWSGANQADETEETRLHPTQKPIKAQRAPIEWYSKPGDDVEDWYMGAGAVIIACEQTGRIGHGMDIAHAYLAATLERLSARGLKPRRVE